MNSEKLKLNEAIKRCFSRQRIGSDEEFVGDSRLGIGGRLDPDGVQRTFQYLASFQWFGIYLLCQNIAAIFSKQDHIAQ